MNNFQYKLFLPFFLILALVICSCDKHEHNPEVPQIETQVLSFTDSSATLGGDLTSSAGLTFTAMGVCYGFHSGPTVDSMKAETTVGPGVFGIPVNFLLANTTYYTRAYVRTATDVYYGDEKSFTTKLLVGSHYRGGIVFYLDPSSSSGLIMATVDAPSMHSFGCKGENINTNVELYTGTENTNRITNTCHDLTIAARYSLDYALAGYSDWFLPSKDELNALHQSSVSSKLSGVYWSSSQNNGDDAWSVNFDGVGDPVTLDKTTECKVRPVRSF